MSKLIIDNQSNLSDDKALQYALTVIREGRISDNGRCYCYATRFIDGVEVYAVRNKASDRFIVRGKA